MSRFREFWIVRQLDPPPPFLSDMNADGKITISDISLWSEWLSEWLEWIFFLPGNALILTQLERRTDLAEFLELTPEWYFGSWSGVFSALVWFVGYGILAFLFVGAINVSRALGSVGGKLGDGVERFFGWLAAPFEWALDRLPKGWFFGGCVLLGLAVSFVLAVTIKLEVGFSLAVFVVAMGLLGGFFYLVGYLDDRRAKKKYARRAHEGDSGS